MSLYIFHTHTHIYMYIFPDGLRSTFWSKKGSKVRRIMLPLLSDAIHQRKMEEDFSKTINGIDEWHLLHLQWHLIGIIRLNDNRLQFHLRLKMASPKVGSYFFGFEESQPMVNWWFGAQWFGK